MSEARNRSQTRQTLRPGHFYGQVLDKYACCGVILSELKHECAKKLPNHSHELALFNLLLAGGYTETFGRRTVNLKPLTVIFHPSGVTHQDQIGQSGIRIFSVELQDQLMERLRECGVVPTSFSDLPGSELSRLATRLYLEYRDLNCCSTLAIEGLVLEMLALTARPQRGLERRPPRWLHRVEDLLRAGFHQNLTLCEVAAEVDLHPAYVSRVFHQFRHHSIGGYLHKLRVQFACQQLLNTDLTLSNIAAATGFSDQSHFTRVFKRCTGMTPGVFRGVLKSGKISEVTSKQDPSQSTKSRQVFLDDQGRKGLPRKPEFATSQREERET